MSDIYWMLALIAWFVSAVVGAIIGAEKGKTGKGALLGFFFGPVGWIMMMKDISPFALCLVVAVMIAAGIYVINEAVNQERRYEVELKAREETRRREYEASLQNLDSERAERVRLQERADFYALPKWDQYGRPINRELPPELASQDQPESTPAPTPALRSLFPSGVDTPEQRRAYLQAQTEERKKQKQLQKAADGRY